MKREIRSGLSVLARVDPVNQPDEIDRPARGLQVVVGVVAEHAGLVGLDAGSGRPGEGEAGVLVPLIGSGPGLWVLPDGATLPAANEADFNNGLLYYNVHDAEFPGGVIRGQIDLP